MVEGKVTETKERLIKQKQQKTMRKERKVKIGKKDTE